MPRPPEQTRSLLERTADGGRKILISGGGRCNILPTRLEEARFVTESPAIFRRIVRSWPLREQIAFFEEQVELPLVEETESSKLFPASQSARDARDRLLALARRKGVEIVTNTLVTGFAPAAGRWRVDRHGDAPLLADALIVATGGLSVPKTGSDGRGLEVVERLGHTIRPTYAALTPLVASPAPFASLSGVSLRVTLTARSGDLTAKASGGFLFTHQGYSGPAVLDVSHVAVRSRGSLQPAKVVVRWTPLGDEEWTVVLTPGADGTRSVLSVLRGHLPNRFAEAIVDRLEIDPRRTLANLTRSERLRLIDIARAWRAALDRRRGLQESGSHRWRGQPGGD